VQSQRNAKRLTPFLKLEKDWRVCYLFLDINENVRLNRIGKPYGKTPDCRGIRFSGCAKNPGKGILHGLGIQSNPFFIFDQSVKGVWV